jgi:hypothetical protein
MRIGKAGIAQSVYRRATGWKGGFDFQQEQEIYFYLLSRPALGPSQLLIQWEPGTLSWSVKRPGPEGDDSSRSNAGVRNGIAITELPIRIHALLLN